jgi:hypothetical protein
MQREPFYTYRRIITFNWWSPTYITLIYYLCCFPSGIEPRLSDGPANSVVTMLRSHYGSYLRTRQKRKNPCSAGNTTSHFIDWTISTMSWTHPYTLKANDCSSVVMYLSIQQLPVFTKRSRRQQQQTSVEAMWESVLKRLPLWKDVPLDSSTV